MTVFAKAPASVVDFNIDWADWLAADETILSSEWYVEPNDADGLLLGPPASAGTVHTVDVAGGIAGKLYRLICRIHTSENRTVERSLSIKVMER